MVVKVSEPRCGKHQDARRGTARQDADNNNNNNNNNVRAVHSAIAVQIFLIVRFPSLTRSQRSLPPLLPRGLRLPLLLQRSQAGLLRQPSLLLSLLHERLALEALLEQ